MATRSDKHPLQRTSRLLLVLAAIALLASPKFPYWQFELDAPQYPDGLRLFGYPNRIEGDVREIDNLNHYIGMRKLALAAPTERKLAIPGIVVLSACLVVAACLRSRWSVLLLLPVAAFPAIFVLDLHLWLRDFGLNLDPRAPLSSSVKPFVPKVLGTGKIAQFYTHGSLGFGFYLSAFAAVVSVFVAFLRLMRRRPRDKSQPSLPVRVAQAVGLAGPLLLLLSGKVEAAVLTVGPHGQTRSLVEALESAAPGDSILVEGNVHAGPITIDKSVRLIGRDGAVIAGSGKGTVVAVTAPDVHLRGFMIRGSGDLLSNEDSGVVVTAPGAVIESNRLEDVLFGIYLKNAPRCAIRKNLLFSKDLPLPRRGDLIRVWYSDDVTIEDNTSAGGRDVVLWFSKQLIVRNNTIRGGRYGLHFMYCHDAVVHSNRLSGNSVGAFLMYSQGLRLGKNWVEHNRGASGYGVGLKDMDDVKLLGNVLTGNRVGMFLENSRGEFRGNLVAYNEKGLSVFPSARGNLFEENTFWENGEQVSIDGLSGEMTTNTWNGNFWSDYRGYDADADGTGDLPYRPARLFERLADRHSALRLFANNPSTEALDFASRVFPIFQPRPKFTDPSPRMAPLPVPVAVSSRSASAAWLCLSMGLLGWPLALLFGFPKTWTGSDATQSLAVRLWTAISACPRRIVQTVGLMPLPRREQTMTTDSGRRPESAAAEQSAASAIVVSDLSKRFGKVTAVDGLNFEVAQGEVVALWGPNGAGKTTVLKCLLGLMPFGGTAFVNGQGCHMRNKAGRWLLGYVPQEIQLHPDQTVVQAVRFYARLRRVSMQRALSLLKEWELQDAQRRLVRHLSGGMKQKLALVLALLSDPPILLLDEPTSNLDAQSRLEFGKLLERLKSDGKTLLFCSHRVSEVWRLADRVIILEQGQKVAEGPPAHLERYLQKPVVLSLTVPHQRCTDAAAILRDAGFGVQANGSQILVDVAESRKVEPITRLTEYGIPIIDFELDDEDK